MIEVYDIIEAVNKILKSKKGHLNKKGILTSENNLTLHRSIREHPKFKIYKVFVYSLYNILKGEKNLLHKIEIVKNVSSSDLMEEWVNCDKEYLVSLIEYLRSDEFKEIIDV